MFYPYEGMFIYSLLYNFYTHQECKPQRKRMRIKCSTSCLPWKGNSYFALLYLTVNYWVTVTKRHTCTCCVFETVQFVLEHGITLHSRCGLATVCSCFWAGAVGRSRGHVGDISSQCLDRAPGPSPLGSRDWAQKSESQKALESPWKKSQLGQEHLEALFPPHVWFVEILYSSFIVTPQT